MQEGRFAAGAKGFEPIRYLFSIAIKKQSKLFKIKELTPKNIEAMKNVPWHFKKKETPKIVIKP